MDVHAHHPLVTLLQRPLVLERRLGDLPGEPAVLDAPKDAGGDGPIGCCPSGCARSPRSLICSKIFSASASIRSVSCSTYQEPPSGSATLATAVSSISTCCVRRAISAACSDGSASVSSSALV